MKTIDMLALAALAAAGYWILKDEGAIAGQAWDGPYPRPMGSNRITSEVFTGPLPRPNGTYRIGDEAPYISVNPRRRHQFEITAPISYGQRPPPLSGISYGQRPPPLSAFPSETARSSSPNQWAENMDVTPPNYGARWLTSY